jgi:5-formyltetrahydrofolate cyclo-ligase
MRRDPFPNQYSFMTQSMTEKATLRRSLLKQRQTMSQEEWRNSSDRLCTALQQSDLFRRATTVLAYFSIRNEPDLSSLFHLEAYRWGFPRCVGKEIAWHHWSPNETMPLQAGAFGIQEPHPESPMLSADEVDLILVPAVACDRQGHRLGYGGGFYDRFLSTPEWMNKPTIGIVFSHSLLEALPRDDWDCPLTAVCTDATFVMTNPNGCSSQPT